MHNKTILAAALLSAFASAQCLDLPGPDGHIAVAASPALVPQNGITVEAWVSLSSLGGRPTIARKNPTAFNESYNLRVEFGSPQFFVQGASGSNQLWALGTQIPLNTPTHIAATYDNATSKIYVNGILVDQSTHNTGPLLDTSGELRIGKGDDVAPSETFLGQIDAVRIWDHARVADRIVGALDRELPIGDGLVGSWNFDNNLDSPGGHTGTGVNTTGFAPEFTAFTQSLQFDQTTGGYLEVPHAPELVPPTGLTLEAWVYFDPQGGGFPTIARKNGAAFGESYALRLEGGFPVFVVQAGGSFAIFLTPTQVPTQQPVHLAATYDGATMAIYMDGVLLGTRTHFVGGPMTDTGGALKIGAGDNNSGANDIFDGRLDSVRLWSMARSEADIRATRDLDVTGLPGLIAAWEFDGDLLDSHGSFDATAVGGTISYGNQVGAQESIANTGISTFGDGSSLCSPAPSMIAYALPRVGTAMGYGSINGVANGLFVNVLGFARLPNALPTAGFDLWIDPAVPFRTAFGLGDSSGSSRSTLSLPNDASFLGVALFSQELWIDSTCGAQGFTATNGLRLEIVE